MEKIKKEYNIKPVNIKASTHKMLESIKALTEDSHKETIDKAIKMYAKKLKV